VVHAPGDEVWVETPAIRDRRATVTRRGPYCGLSAWRHRATSARLIYLVVHRSDFDVLIPSHSRMGKFSGGKRISMLRATPG